MSMNCEWLVVFIFRREVATEYGIGGNAEPTFFFLKDLLQHLLRKFTYSFLQKEKIS